MTGFVARAALAVALASIACGCDFGRHSLANPGTSQVVRVESGDRVFFSLDEDAKDGILWDFTCDDGDVEVRIEHLPSGRADVLVRIHRGYDGPSTVDFFRRRRGGPPESAGRFTLSLFKRTGDCAFWE